jgi:flagella basal body P-ring formation protein FlgA
MKYIIILSILFSFTALSSESCRIETRSKIYHVGTTAKDQPLLYLSSSCSELVNRSFIELLKNSSGVINAKTLALQITNDQDHEVQISPERINVFNLSDVLKRSFNLSESLNFDDIKITDQSPLLFNENEWIEFSCPQCNSTGEKNIRITITNSFDGNTTSRYLNAKLKARVEALVASSNLRVTNQSADLNSFTTQTIETDKPENLFTDLKTLNFFRLNRPLVHGEALKHSDLTPAPLVQPGTQATVILVSNGLELSSLAMPVKSARFGETVQLRALDSNRIILGKVIDFNKVEVNL